MSAAQPPPPRLEMHGITKRYPGVVANDGIDLDVKGGEIHALLGENGAAKKTLMNVLFGLARPDEGEILIDGQPVQIADPADGISRGIGMVHQHCMLVPILTVAENILLGAETMVGTSRCCSTNRAASASRIPHHRWAAPTSGSRGFAAGTPGS